MESIQSQSQDDQAQLYQDLLILPKAGRTFLVGMTGSGKTILGDQLRNLWLQKYTSGKCLIVDSKPHYRAQWELSGISAAYRYRKWIKDDHDYVAGSYRLDLGGNLKAGLKACFAKSRVVIAQGGRGSWPALMDAMQQFYEMASAKGGPRLLYIDEGADFFELDRFGGPILQALRAGRQLGLGVILGSQRPKFISKSVLTESDRIYLGKLKNNDDLKALQIEGGLPKELNGKPLLAPDRFHEFKYFNFYEPGLNGLLFTLGGIS